MEASSVSGRRDSLGRTALLLAVAAVVTMVVLAAIDHDGAAWFLQAVFGLAAAVTGYRAGGTSPKNGAAFAGLTIGTILFLIFAAFVVTGG